MTGPVAKTGCLGPDGGVAAQLHHDGGAGVGRVRQGNADALLGGERFVDALARRVPEQAITGGDGQGAGLGDGDDAFGDEFTRGADDDVVDGDTKQAGAEQIADARCNGCAWGQGKDVAFLDKCLHGVLPRWVDGFVASCLGW